MSEVLHSFPIAIVLFFFIMFPIYKFHVFIERSIKEWKRLTFDDLTRKNLLSIMEKSDDRSDLIFYGGSVNIRSLNNIKARPVVSVGCVATFIILTFSLPSWQKHTDIHPGAFFLLAFYLVCVLVELKSNIGFIAITKRTLYYKQFPISRLKWLPIADIQNVECLKISTSLLRPDSNIVRLLAIDIGNPKYKLYTACEDSDQAKELLSKINAAQGPEE